MISEKIANRANNKITRLPSPFKYMQSYLDELGTTKSLYSLKMYEYIVFLYYSKKDKKTIQKKIAM